MGEPFQTPYHICGRSKSIRPSPQKSDESEENTMKHWEVLCPKVRCEDDVGPKVANLVSPRAISQGSLAERTALQPEPPPAATVR